MVTTRTLAIFGAAFVAGLLLIHAPAGAQSQSTAAGAPLSLTPAAAKVGKRAPVRSTTAAKRTRRSVASAKRSATPAPSPVMRSDDSIALIAKLPWWRSDERATARYRSAAAVSQVLTAADAWLGAAATATDAYASASLAPLAEDSGDAAGQTVGLVEPSELNAIDRAMGNPSDRTWLAGLLAIVAGALAAGATARFLFV